ncbi:MAG: hypothetical protein PHF50_02375 [Patescibacteria group bacterium]|nr:hypothetical protein [Patescibacteria group bacterium]
MYRKFVLFRVLKVVARSQRKDFVGELTEGVLLTDVFGENQWHTLGTTVVRADLIEIFAVDIPEDGLCDCKTIGDLVEIVVSLLKQQPIKPA